LAPLDSYTRGGILSCISVTPRDDYIRTRAEWKDNANPRDPRRGHRRHDGSQQAARRLAAEEWQITVVDKDDIHDYQPAYLFMPFGINKPSRSASPAHTFIDDGIEVVMAEVDASTPKPARAPRRTARAAYDYLIIATARPPAPTRPPGCSAPVAQERHEFYTFDGMVALREVAEAFTGRPAGHAHHRAAHQVPGRPLEFVMLADDYLKKGVREATEIVYVTPLDGAFTKPVASRELGHHLSTRNIKVEPDFMIESVDQEAKVIRSYDEREVPYDLLVTVPLNMGADFVAARSGLGDELNYVPVDKHTMQSTAYDNIFALGDASNLPTSKAGSVAHFSVEVFVENFCQLAAGRPMTHSFDGHANCFVESGNGQGAAARLQLRDRAAHRHLPAAGSAR
jgi:sulfide:quinone oxidoreductase